MNFLHYHAEDLLKELRAIDATQHDITEHKGPWMRHVCLYYLKDMMLDFKRRINV